MKPFAFSLEAVLTVRAREEQAAAEAWALAVQNQTRAEQALEQAKQELENYHRLLERQRSARFHPGDQQVYLNAIVNQEMRCEELAIEYTKALQAAKAQHVLLLQARIKHEVLLRLKEKKMNEYKSSVQAKEEAAIEDLIIVRHGRGRTSV